MSATRTVSRASYEVHVATFGHSRIDFKRSLVRKELRAIGRLVVKDAKRLVSKRNAGPQSQYPGRRTGALLRAIKARAARSGLSVAVAPFRTADLMRKGDQAYYPGFLLYGAARKRGGALHPRENYIEAAALRHQGTARERLSAVLNAALIPRK